MAMAREKNPSIYDDRSAIGSSEELDEYGVWVKSGPQDISGDFSLEDPSEEFSADEENADISLDFSIPAQDDLSNFSDFTASGESENLEAVGDSDDNFDTGEFSFETSEIDDISDFGGQGGGSTADADISFETIENGDAEEKEPDQSIDFDIPLEPGADETIDFDSFMESEAGTRDSAAPPSPAQADSFTGEISFEENGPEDTTEVAFEESGDDFEISFEDGGDFSELPGEAFPPETRAEKTEPAAAEPAVNENEETRFSTQILLQIVDELSSIKAELSSLKKELITVSPPQGKQAEAAQGAGGFFDESDDEKIALTGAEMDNILHTASFTEETGSDSTAAAEDAGIEESSAAQTPSFEPNSQPVAVEIDMDDFGPEPEMIAPDEDLTGLPDDFAAGLNADLSEPEPSILAEENPLEEPALPGSESEELSIGDFSEDLDDGILLDMNGELPLDTEISMDESDELPLGTEILMDADDESGVEIGETDDLDLDANLSLDFPPEDEEAAATTSDSSIEDSFARLIPEGFEEKPTELSLHREVTLEEDIPDSEILLEDEAPDTKLPDEDFSVSSAAGESIDLSSGFELDTELKEDASAVDTGIPEVSLDLDRDFDTGAPVFEEDIPVIEDEDDVDITEDISADTENGETLDEEMLEIDLSDEPFEPLDLPAFGNSESPVEDISFDLSAEDSSTEEPTTEEPTAEEPAGEALPDFVLEDEPADEFSVEEDTLPADFSSEFSVETLDAADAALDTTNAAPEDAPVAEADVEFTADEPLDLPPLDLPPEEFEEPSETPAPSAKTGDVPAGSMLANVPVKIREELKTVLTYMDQLLESLPEEKIEEFAKTEYFDTYKKLFEDLGLV